MRYPASKKTEIIRLVEQSPQRTLEKLGIPRSSFYRWYDRPSRPDRVRNRIPEPICGQIIDLVLEERS